jgi:hypothetical protein
MDNGDGPTDQLKAIELVDAFNNQDLTAGQPDPS